MCMQTAWPCRPPGLDAAGLVGLQVQTVRKTALHLSRNTVNVNALLKLASLKEKPGQGRARRLTGAELQNADLLSQGTPQVPEWLSTQRGWVWDWLRS